MGQNKASMTTHLNNPLTQTHEVGANTNCTTSDDTESEALLVGMRCLLRDQGGAAQVLHGDVEILTDYIHYLVALLSLLNYPLAVDRVHLFQLFVVVRGQVEVVKALTDDNGPRNR